ncbi:hypothetical protein ABIE13_002986 [Ottowia thiooxydans]|uniref:Uncharacterized protein n=2 Tax=Ottowia thiooxydans TaxID=219182 RepID=A0ABV2QB80_9BURK
MDFFRVKWCRILSMVNFVHNNVMQPASSRVLPSASNTVRALGRFRRSVYVAGAILMGASSPTWAQSNASLGVSLLPVASVLVTGAIAGAVSRTAVAVPVALAVSGAVLTIKAVEVSAHGTVYVLERASDGATASVRLSERALSSASASVGTALVTTVIASGTILSAAGEAIAFVPNEAGQALLHSERLI